MKKIFYTLLISTVLLSLLAAKPQPDKTEAPRPNAPAQSIIYGLTCGQLGNTDAYGQCVNFPGVYPDKITLSANMADYNHSIAGVGISCTGVDCWKVDIYVEWTITETWYSNWSGPQNLRVVYQNKPDSSTNWPWGWGYGCGSGSSDQCTIHGYFKIPASNMLNSRQGYQDHLNALMRWGIRDGWATHDNVWTITATFSLTPFNTSNCDEAYQIMDELVAEGTIQANDQDGEAAALESGEKYRLTTYGGPWNDGTSNRYDAAVSFDSGSNYTPMYELAAAENWNSLLCAQNASADDYSTTIVFEASSTSMRVRVNDTNGAFGNNTGTLNYSLYKVRAVLNLSCSSQYTYGESSLLISGTINANDGAGVWVVPANHYQAYGTWLAIEVAGSWLNNGVGNSRDDLAIGVSDNLTTDRTWYALNDYEYKGCQGDGVYFIQVTKAVTTLRVNDSDGNWASNTGTMTYSVYKATYSPRQTDCEQMYSIGSLLETNYVEANSANGIEILTQAKSSKSINSINYYTGEPDDLAARIFVLETTSGPWMDGAVPSYLAEIYDGSNWYALDELPAVVCVRELDTVGHMRVYFTYDQAENYKLRVEDDDYGNNTGRLGYSVYEGTEFQVAEPGECWEYYYPEEDYITISLNAKTSGGYWLPAKSAEEVIVIETYDGPWKNNGSSNSYAIAISDDGGETWQEAGDYDWLLCVYQEDANHYVYFLRSPVGSGYKVRVYDTDGNWSANTNSIDVKFYTSVESENKPWKSCADDYHVVSKMTKDADRYIPGNLEGGVQVDGIVMGELYALEITDESSVKYEDEEWYSAEISKDNGKYWSDFYQAPFAVCLVSINYTNVANQRRYRIYFVAGSDYSQYTSGSPYRLRVELLYGSYPALEGGLYYRLYQAAEGPSDLPKEDKSPDAPEAPASWGAACRATCMRPQTTFFQAIVPFSAPISNLIAGLRDFIGLGETEEAKQSTPVANFADWLEYLRCNLQKLFVWCPEHTEFIKLFFGQFASYEPFGTLYDTVDFMAYEKDRFSTYNWHSDIAPESVLGGETEGGGDPGLLLFGNNAILLPKIKDAWNTGKLEWPGLGEGGEGGLSMPNGYQDWLDVCNDNLQIHFLDSSAGVCAVSGFLFIFGSAGMIIQITVNVAFTVGLFKHLYKTWVKPALY